MRWTDDYAYITTRIPDAKPYLWGLLGATHDQGRRARPGTGNPFWGEEPANVPGLRPSPTISAAVARVRRRHLRRLLRAAARRRAATSRANSFNEHPGPLGSDQGRQGHLPSPTITRSLTMSDALAVLPPKVRAAIYLLLIVANAVVTPLMAAGVIPSLYGTVILSLLNVFGGATALANVRRDPDAAVAIAYDAKHDDE